MHSLHMDAQLSLRFGQEGAVCPPTHCPEVAVDLDVDREGLGSLVGLAAQRTLVHLAVLMAITDVLQ